jgi:hypothetical protein
VISFFLSFFCKATGGGVFGLLFGIIYYHINEIGCVFN